MESQMALWMERKMDLMKALWTEHQMGLQKVQMKDFDLAPLKAK